MTDDRPDIEGIEARHAASTPGDWYYNPNDSVPMIRSEVSPGEIVEVLETGYWNDAEIGCSHTDTINKQDREFVLHAHQDIPALIAYARELEAERLIFAQHTVKGACDILCEQGYDRFEAFALIANSTEPENQVTLAEAQLAGWIDDCGRPIPLSKWLTEFSAWKSDRVARGVSET